MRNVIAFLFGFILFGYATYVFSAECLQDECVAYWWNPGGTGFATYGYIQLTFDPCTGFTGRNGIATYPTDKSNHAGVQFTKYRWNNVTQYWDTVYLTNTYNDYDNWANWSYDIMAPILSAQQPAVSGNPNTLGLTPETVCVSECAAREGETGETWTAGMYPDGPFCIEDCQAVIGNQLYAPDLLETLSFYNFSGEDCQVGEPPVDPTVETCSDKQAMCEKLCIGGDMNFSCTEPPVVYDCGCELPPPGLPVVNNPITGKVEPDQDKDGEGSGTDTDNNGNGIPNGQDPDVDGNGELNGQDKDVDGDAHWNNGYIGWTYKAGSANGIGADPNIDGDEYANGADSNVDGDTSDNGSDPDIDGDDIGNGPDLDANGDGILDAESSDPDGDGIIGADDSDPDGSTISDSDTNGDGEVDENDEDATAAPAAIEGGTCPAGQICAGDGVCQSGESETSSDCVTDDYFQTRWAEMRTSVSGSGVFALVDSLGGLPASSDSSVGVSLGNWGGEQSFDLTKLNFAWTIINGFFIILGCWLGVKIIILKGA